MSKRYICTSKFHVCYHILDIYENLRRKNLTNPSCPKHAKIIKIKNDIILIFTFLRGASEKFHLFEVPKRNVKIKNSCHFSLLFY